MVVNEDKVIPELSWADFWERDYVSYRRYLLDFALNASALHLHGKVVDVGGKQEKKRGKFRPGSPGNWIYLNIDQGTNPHAVADAHVLPVANDQADFVVCTETIEHLQRPKECVQECLRILKPAGTLILSVPFLYPVHADPQDFQRFTKDGLLQQLEGFTTVDISTMGGAWGVIGMMIEFAAIRSQRRLWRGVMWRIGRFFQWLDLKLGCPYSEHFTTGYFIVAVK